ncbi:minor tail protein [Mycobacterium phage Aminay]|uniref:Minor tail protein n=1 Tax=Mycobacterium phage Aminay TaxID=2250291 RepID=A0A345KV07_9CAUD|nr:minor tail protein [Mycobacterium phage Aminay]AXH46859.1 minor tail protein [Mycobacterium phage Aminay]
MAATILSAPVIGADGPPDPETSPLSAYRYLDARRDVIEAEAKARPLIRLWDKRMQYIGTVASEKSVNAEEMIHDTGQGDIVLRGDDWLVEFLRADVRKDEDLHITIDPYPHRRNWRWRWGSKVVNARVKRDENGIRTVTFECAHNREHWKHLYFGATPFMPPEVQPLRSWLLPGNTRTIIATTGFINLARNYWPALALPTQAFNPGAWLGESSNPLNLNPLNWPVQMQFVNPVFDQSRFSVIMSRWSDAHSVTDAMLKDSGCNVRAYTWLPEDEDSPHPELAAIIGEQAARPSRACIVLAVEDKSRRAGWTGTALDGPMNLIGALADNAVTESVYQVIGNNEVIDPRTNSPAPPIISKLLGVAPKLPDITFRDGKYSPIITSEHSMFRSKASKILTGGKSPGWVNQTQTFLIKYALSELSALISQGPFAAQAPATSGLEEIYQGQADNMLLAFVQVTDPVRAAAAGPYGFLEHFEQGSGSAYTVSSGLTLREGHWKTRPYQAFKVSVRNARPHTLYYDFDLADPALFEIDGILYNDHVSAVKLHYDETTPKTFDLSIGDDSESESPMAQVTRSMQTFWSALSMLFGSGDMF